MANTHYCRIGVELLDRLRDLVLNGQSVALLGARHIGKRYVLSRLQELLFDARHTCIGRVRFLESQLGDPQNEDDHHPLGEDDQATVLPPDVEAVFRWCDPLLHDERGTTTLLATNVDSMPFHRVRSFLTGVRTRVERKDPFQGRFTVVLTGELDLRHLVYGPESAFNCAHQFVIQGFAEDEFELYGSTYAAAIGLSIDGSESGFFRELWKRTGGNIYFLRLLFWAAFEKWTTQRASKPCEVKLADIPTRITWSRVPWAYRPGQVRRIDRVIAQSPQCWATLKALRANEFVPTPLGEPELLELAGFAVREKGELRLSSPLIEQLVEHHYNDWRFAGFRALKGEWDVAFAEYAKLPLDDRIRPRDSTEVEETEAVVGALCAHLHRNIPEGPNTLERLLMRGAELVLGFRKVSFWKHEGQWHIESSEQSSAPLDNLGLYQEVLACLTRPSSGVLPTPHRYDHRVLVATIPGLSSGQWRAVIIGKPDDSSDVSPERRRLAQILLEHFVLAYSHAIDVERNRIRLIMRDQYSKIIADIFEVLGSEVTDVSQALARAAQSLRKLGYRRVLFCLVDAMKARIRGVLDSSDDPHVNVARMTDWPLDSPMADVQPYVIATKRTKVIEDARAEPLTNKDVVNCAGLRAMAVVPIINRRNEAIGTVHVERADCATPNCEEVEDLEEFARQLAVAIAKSEKENLLQSALAKQPEPILIFDVKGVPVFASKEAASLLGMKAGWATSSADGSMGSSEMLRPLRELAIQAMREGHRFVRPTEQPAKSGTRRRSLVLTDLIENWRHETVGAFCHIQELNHIYRVFEAIQLLLADWKDTDSVLDGVLRATAVLGHKWGRLYVLSEEVPDCFVSKASFGLADSGLAEDFNRGRVVLSSRKILGHESWVCVEQEQPLVFGCRPELPNQDKFFTSQGLEVQNVQDSHCPARLEKRAGDIWIDFPLMAGGRVMGKITLQCDEDYRPEDLAFLRMLFVVTRQLLEASIRWERRMDWIHEASERAIADTSHHIATTLAALPVLLARYRRLDKSVTGLTDLNRDFARLCDHLTTTIRHTKDRLAPVAIQRDRSDIMQKLRGCLSSTLAEGSWDVSGPEVLPADFDARLLQGAFLELVQNSKQCSPSLDALRIGITVQVLEREGQEFLVLGYYDNGPGIPSGFRGLIFQNFFSRRPGRKTGTGLGMGYVRRIVEAHGGTIEVRGEQERGVCFVISLPRYAQSQTGEVKGNLPCCESSLSKINQTQLIN